MKTTLFTKNSAFLLLMLMITSVTFSQGLEDFTNLNISTGSYSSGNFTGNNGIAWDYVEVRGTDTSSVTYPNVDHPAMMLRRASDNSSITSSLIPNGIQDFSVKLYKGFTGNGPRQVEVLINGQPVGQSVPFDDFDEHIFTVNNINVAGDFTLEIRNVTSSQVVIDDISWTAYNSGGNLPPTISQITLTPDAHNIKSTDIVIVEAMIVDSDGVASATLNWGTTSGNLTNSVAMTLGSANVYDATIPAQTDGTTVYFEITATDLLAATATTLEYDYTVADIPMLSLPYSNDFRTQADYDQAENLGFTLTNTTQQTTAGGYLRIEANGSVTTPLIDFSVLDAILFDFSMTTFGGDSGQGLQVSISEDGGSTFTALDTYTATTNYDSHTQFIDLSSINSTDGMIRVSLVPGTSNSHVVRFRDMNITEFSGGNLPPTISQITLTPDAHNIKSTDIVTVEASITDPDGVASATLNWGTTSGNLTNSVAMTLGSANVYDATIPAQTDGTTVYFEITATDSLSETATTLEYDYTVADIPMLSLPYSNDFRTQTDYDQAENLGFTITNSSQQTGGGGYLRIETNGSLTSPLIDFSTLDAILFDFSMTSYGGFSNQGLQISISEDGGNTFTDLDFYEVPSSSSNYIDYTQFVDVSTSNSTDGMIRVALVPGTGSTTHVARFRDMEITEFSGYFYNNAWAPSNPELNSTAADDVYVVEGSVDILSDLSSKNFVVFPGAAANIHAVLSVAEDLSINGDLRFISSPNSIGELAEMSPTSNIFGQAEVQIYSSDRRAYRMVSSAVTTPTSIHDNWQEGAVSNTDDPAPGFGTHITGTLIDQEDGFDATATGNPSMFVVDIANQEFVSIDNTDVNTLDAGTPYLLFIRGDRSIDLNSNTSHSSTVLRSKGELQHGSITVNFPAMQIGEFAMFGNPYQSAVDITQVFAASDYINPNHYYVFDPNIGTNGSYVTVNLDTIPISNTSGSPANEFLQPGQAAQFASLQNASPVLNFSEAHKAPGNHTQTSAQRMTISDMVTFQLFTTDNFSNGETLHDSFGIVFSPNYSNNIDEFDASKPMNFDENMGLNVNGKLISLERREMPVEGEVYQIHTSGYSTENYTIKMMIDGLDNFVLTLYDAYEDTYTQLVNNDATIYNFEVSENDANSLAENRFSIHVEDLLSVNAYNSSTIRIYPNPIVSDSFAIFAPNQTGKEASVSIIDMLGRTVYADVYTIADGTATVNIGQNMNEGIYIVKLIIDGETQTFRVIKK